MGGRASLTGEHDVGPGRGGLRLIGYASGLRDGPHAKAELEDQARTIDRGCQERGFHLVEVVYERQPSGNALTRPGLAYALGRISEGYARGLAVAELTRLARSAAELGKILEWLRRQRGRLLAVGEGLDTDSDDGRLAAAVLVSVSDWERARLSERTRIGLMAARSKGRLTGRPAVRDDPELTGRIARMREAGMTLQGIADRLNEEGVPTVRGGALWRHSSVQATVGYRRQPPRKVADSEGIALGNLGNGEIRNGHYRS